MRFGCSIVPLLSGLSALGQMNTGEIAGRVQDPTSSALPSATIVAQHVDTVQKFTTFSNSSGEYLFAQLPVGPYSLTASATDFNPRCRGLKSTPATACGATSAWS